MLVVPVRRRIVMARLRNAAMTPGAAGGTGLGLVLVEVHVSDHATPDDPVHMIGHYLDSPPGRIRSAQIPTGRC